MIILGMIVLEGERGSGKTQCITELIHSAYRPINVLTSDVNSYLEEKKRIPNDVNIHHSSSIRGQKFNIISKHLGDSGGLLILDEAEDCVTWLNDELNRLAEIHDVILVIQPSYNLPDYIKKHHHYVLYHDYIQERKNGEVENPLLSRNRTTLFYFENHRKTLDRVIGVDEASNLWGLSAGRIKNMCAEGLLACKKIGNTWVIDRLQPNPKKRERSTKIVY